MPVPPDRSSPAVLVIAATVLVAGVGLPASWTSVGIHAGAMFAFGSPDRWLSLAALGLVLGTQDGRRLTTACTAFVGGAAFGTVCRHSAFWPAIADPSMFPHLHLLGPGACLLSGLLLLTSGHRRHHLLPLASFAVAASLLLGAAINDPAPRSYAFAAGTSLASLSFALAATSLRRSVCFGWLPIAERIAGSWLLTIGLLLSAVRLLPSDEAIADANHAQTQSTARPIAFPNIPPAVRPDGYAFPDPLGSRGMPKGTN